MRFHSIALLTGATAVAAGNTANILLPGFEGQDLQAGIIDSVSVVRKCRMRNAPGCSLIQRVLTISRMVMRQPIRSPAPRPSLLKPAASPAMV